MSPPTGTADVTITLSDEQSSVVLGIASFSGANQALGAMATASGTSGGPTVSATSMPGELVVGFVMWNGVTPLSPAQEQDVQWNVNALEIVSAGSTAPGATMVPMGWTVSEGLNDS